MKKYGVGIISVVVLLLGFVLCRYVFFDVHGMKSWPLMLLAVGGVVLVLSVLCKCRCLPWFTSLGYPVSFAIAAVFQQTHTSPSGMTSNNLYLIWIIAYAAIIVIGVIAEAAK